MFSTPFAEETQTQNGHRNMQIKENTCIHLFPISCMLSSLSIGQETWCGFVGFFFFFLISRFVLLYFQKHPVKKWEWQKESLKVSKEVPLWLMQGFALRNRKPNLKPTFQIRQSMDGMLSGLGEQLWFLEVTYQIFFPMCWSFLCLFHCYQNPVMLYFSTALQD